MCVYPVHSKFRQVAYKSYFSTPPFLSVRGQQEKTTWFQEISQKFQAILPYLDAQTKDNIGDTEDLKKEKEGEFGFPFIEKMYILLIFYKKQIPGIKLGHYQWH